MPVLHCLPQARFEFPPVDEERTVTGDKCCIEMKPLIHHGSCSNTSTDTFSSCLTHLPTSPCSRGQGQGQHPSSAPPSDHHHGALYVNPLDDPPSGFPNYDTVMNVFPTASSAKDLKLAHSAHACSSPKYAPNKLDQFGSNDNNAAQQPSDQIIQTLDDGFTTTWKRANSPTPLQADMRVPLQPTMVRNIAVDCENPPRVLPRSSLKRHKSESSSGTGSGCAESCAEQHVHVGDAELVDRVYSSTDNLHEQGFSKPPKLKFRKAMSLANRLHSSPSTGRKLANYHLVASASTGKPPGALIPSCLCCCLHAQAHPYITNAHMHTRACTRAH
jgi:hypothetical protein